MSHGDRPGYRAHKAAGEPPCDACQTFMRAEWAAARTARRLAARVAEPTDVDEVAVERAVGGDRNVPLTRYEMAEAWRQLEDRRLTADMIGARLGVSGRTVGRWRSGELHPASRPGRGKAAS